MSRTTQRLLGRWCGLAVAVGLVGGCAPEVWDALFPRDLCLEIRPILVSPHDTAETLRQVTEQAALIREVCAP